MTAAALQFNAPRVLAKRQLESRRAYGALTPERLYWLWRDATGNVEEAERLEAELILARSRQSDSRS